MSLPASRTNVPGSVIDGQGFDADGASGTAWFALAAQAHAGPDGVADGAALTVLPRSKGHKYAVDHRAGVLYFRTNRDAKPHFDAAGGVDNPVIARNTEDGGCQKP